MAKHVSAQTLAKRAKVAKLAKRMTETIKVLGNVEVYHTLQYPNEDGEDYNEEFILIGEEKLIEQSVNLLDAMFGYTERIRFTFESGIVQVPLTKVTEEKGDE